MQYPAMTEEKAQMMLSAYEERVEEKWLLKKQGYPNALAEVVLDRRGYPRPPGWHSVFFYPESYRIRNVYLVIVLICMTIWLYNSWK